jgi:hypothetical protein
MQLDGGDDVDESASPAMTSGSMRAWLRPTLGALLFMAGTAGVAYKVITGYRHAAPDAFISVQDQNKVPAPSVPAAEPPAASAAAATSPGSTAITAAAPAAAAPVTPVPAAVPPAVPIRVSREVAGNASSNDLESDSSADAQNDSCGVIKTEQHEIEGALHKKYSSEEGRYLERRLRELSEQSLKLKCGE